MLLCDCLCVSDCRNVIVYCSDGLCMSMCARLECRCAIVCIGEQCSCVIVYCSDGVCLFVCVGLQYRCACMFGCLFVCVIAV